MARQGLEELRLEHNLPDMPENSRLFVRRIIIASPPIPKVVVYTVPIKTGIGRCCMIIGSSMV